MFVGTPAFHGRQSGNNSTIIKIGREYLKLFIDDIELRSICDLVELLQIQLQYERSRERRADLKSILFKFSMNGGQIHAE